MNKLGVDDKMRANGSVHSHVLLVQLKSNFTLLQPQLQGTIATSFAEEIASKAANTQGKITILLLIMMRLTPIRLHRSSGFHNDVLEQTITPSLDVILVSIETTRKRNVLLISVAQDPVFLEAALYPQDVFIASEALRFMPSILAPYLHAQPD